MLLSNLDATQKLSSAIAPLLIADNASAKFFGWMLIQVPRSIDNSISTMCVNFNPSLMRTEMRFSEKFVLDHKPSELRGVVIHEMLHLLNKHILRSQNRNTEKWNWAADLAVNRLIEEEIIHNSGYANRNDVIIRLPEFALRPNKKTDPNQPTTAEWYYDNLKKNDDNGKFDLKGGLIGIFGSCDSHDTWKSFSDEASEESIDNEIQSLVRQATQAAGNVPGGVGDLINGLFESKVSWRHILRNFVGSRTKVNTVPTWQRQPRRFPPTLTPAGLLQQVVPGKKYVRTGNIGIIMDTSGSVPDNDLKQFMSEVDIIAKTHKVYICECDAAVHDVYEYNSKTYKKSGRKILGRGGTDMSPGIRKMGERRDIDMLMCFTDGYLFGPPEVSKIPMLWLITTGGSDAYVKDQRHVVMKNK